MKRIMIGLVAVFLLSKTANAQEATTTKEAATMVIEDVSDSDRMAEEVIKRKTAEEKAAKRAEDAARKAEKEKKHAEKELKRREKHQDAIKKRENAIQKKEREIVKLENKITKKKIKGKLTPIDEMEMNQDIDKLKLNIMRDKDKLAKLKRSQK